MYVPKIFYSIKRHEFLFSVTHQHPLPFPKSSSFELNAGCFNKKYRPVFLTAACSENVYERDGEWARVRRRIYLCIYIINFK